MNQMVEVTALTSFAGPHFAMHETETKLVSPENAAEWLRLGWVRRVVHGAANAVADATAENNSNAPVAQARRGRPAKH
jgi:hypothetical protein